jgi:hypothetical protein
MMGIALERWAAWAPGIETPEAWRAWARAPRALHDRGAPAAEFLPSLARRRCDEQSRTMLEVAYASCEADRRGEVACVFASRHGSFATTVSLLEDLAANAPLSPTRFSHSVHNTPAGLFSIWAGNLQPSTALAAREETFAHGMLEAACLLHREPGRPVMLVVGDEPVPAPLAPIADREHGSYALALRLGPGPSIRFRLEASTDPGAVRTGVAAWPPALEFLRWWLSGDATLRLISPLHTWVFDRGWTERGLPPRRRDSFSPGRRRRPG